jgi:hypothetical protein
VLKNLFGTTISTLGQRLIGKIASAHAILSWLISKLCMHVNSYGDLCAGVRFTFYDDLQLLNSEICPIDQQTSAGLFHFYTLTFPIRRRHFW